jgi:hypothetical protein
MENNSSIILDRHCRIFGEVDPGTIIRVIQDGVIIFSGLVDLTNQDNLYNSGIEIFKFYPEYKTNGWKHFKIQVIEGRITFGRSVAYYWVHDGYNDCWGWVATIQQMFIGIDPKFHVKINNVLFEKSLEDQALSGEWIHELNKGDCLTYYHLVPNGPRYWEVKLLDEFVERFNFDRIVPSHGVSQTVLHYDYDFPAHPHPQSLENLENLKKQILENDKYQL